VVRGDDLGFGVRTGIGPQLLDLGLHCLVLGIFTFCGSRR